MHGLPQKGTQNIGTLCRDLVCITLYLLGLSCPNLVRDKSVL